MIDDALLAYTRRVNAPPIPEPVKAKPSAVPKTNEKPPAPPPATSTVSMRDPELATEPQDGAALLDDILNWLSAYVHLPPFAAIAITLWIAATWFVDVTDFAPLLLLLSPTKRCGKTLLLHLVSLLARRGYSTSGSGITTAIVFRLNDKFTPTICIDEAEKLSGRDADKALIGMLNAGYRRGSKVQRCIEKNGDYEIREFVAFGFRALASIKTLWDTVMDRGILIHLERKPQDVGVRRFAGKVVEAEAMPLTRRLARWAADMRAMVGEEMLAVPRPKWLHDRECDNWSILFAIACTAGGEWPQRATDASKALTDQAFDPIEQLVHDCAQVYKAKGEPEVIASGELVTALNELETSPWGCWGKTGRGLTAHTLAAMFKPLNVRPSVGRSAAGTIRGYWLAELKPVFERYPLPPAGLLQPLQEQQSSQGADSSGNTPDPCNSHEVLQTPEVLRDDADADSLVTHVTDVTVGAEGGGAVSCGHPLVEGLGGVQICPRCERERFLCQLNVEKVLADMRDGA